MHAALPPMLLRTSHSAATAKVGQRWAWTRRAGSVSSTPDNCRNRLASSLVVTLRAPCLPLRKLRQTGGIQMLATVASSSFDTTKRRPSASNRTPPSFSTSSSIVFLVTERTRNPSLAANVKPPALPIHHLTLWHAYAFMRQHSLFVTLRPHASSLPRSDRICGAPAFGSYQ
jgi:hypothetical protein